MITVDQAKCTGCGECVKVCPENAIDTAWGTAIVNERQCSECGACVDNCPEKALLNPSSASVDFFILKER